MYHPEFHVIYVQLCMSVDQPPGAKRRELSIADDAKRRVKQALLAGLRSGASTTTRWN